MVSVGMHAAFILTSSVFRIPGVVVPPSSPQRLFQVRIARNEPVAPQPQNPVNTTTEEEVFRFETPSVIRQVDSFLKKEQEESKEKRELVLDQTMEEIAKVDSLPELISPHKSTVERTPVVPVDSERSVTPASKAIELNVDELIDNAAEVIEPRDYSQEFVDKMPGFTPVLVKSTFDVAQRVQPKEFKLRQMPVVTRISDVGHLESELVWTLGTYEDPNDKQKYFKITIQAGEDNKKLKTNAKEVLFLVDCSKSVEDDRLTEFKEGLQKALKMLNEDDVFNIIVFKELLFEFKEGSVKPTPETLKEAARFMENFRTAEKTDAFEVLTHAISKNASRKPVYIVLLSDGRPTKGVTNPREVINKISEINSGKKAIYTLSGGLRVNRYLLDFIAYRNRGWSEYSQRTNLIGEQLVTLYEKIDDPIILNLRYYLSGIDDRQTYPKILPDFFRHAEFTLYGKYDNEREFAMQLLGDVEGKAKEYILKSDFQQAYVGDEEIARNWAFNKIFDLISQLKYNADNTKTIEEIIKLSEKFGLKTPYLEDIIK